MANIRKGNKVRKQCDWVRGFARCRAHSELQAKGMSTWPHVSAALYTVRKARQGTLSHGRLHTHSACIALHSQVHNSTMTVAEFKPIFYWEYSHRMWGKWELPGFRVSGSLRVQGQRDPTAIPTRCDCFLRMSSFSTAAVPKCVAPCGAALHHAALRCTMRRCVAPCGAALHHAALRCTMRRCFATCV